MAAKIGKSKDGHLMHYSVGAIIERGGKYLMIDRAVLPYGFACIAGHIETGEDPMTALAREVEEESGMKVQGCEKILETEVDWNLCSRGIRVHYWHLFECVAEGDPVLFSAEEKSIGWYSPEELGKMKLEPIWEYWLKKRGII
ncbi:MAG: NUDIX hydrolase [bacterium]